MAEVLSSLLGGVVGAVACVDVPAEGERAPRPAPGTDWTGCCSLLQQSCRELDGCVQQATFLLGQLACCMRTGVQTVGCCLAEGRPLSASSCCLLDKAEVEQSIDASKRGAHCLLRGGRLALEAAAEAAKVAATRALIVLEAAREAVCKHAPHTQEKLGQAYASFLRGYQGAARQLHHAAAPAAPPAYQLYGSQQPSTSYGAPPASAAQPSGFFW